MVKKFGRYELLSRVSVGGMAEIFKGRSSGAAGFEKIMAIKRILPHLSDDEDFINMFIDEAKLSANLNHSNIGQVFEFGRIEGRYFIAMEFINGKDLRRLQQYFRTQKKVMPITMAVRVVLEICNALEYAHVKADAQGNSLGIVHRDISPQNIIISYEGAVKLIDFGIAKALSRSTKTAEGNLKGKFGYMSPEQVEGGQIDGRSDLFALGTLLFELVTGKRLFQGESELAVLEKVRKAQVPSPSAMNPSVPQPLEEIILKGLSRRMDDRYQHAEEMHEDLERFAQQSKLVFTSKQLSRWMKKTFEDDIRQESQAPSEASQPSMPTRPGASPSGPGANSAVTRAADRPVSGEPEIDQQAKATAALTPGQSSPQPVSDQETAERVAQLRASLLGSNIGNGSDDAREEKKTERYNPVAHHQPPRPQLPSRPGEGPRMAPGTAAPDAGRAPTVPLDMSAPAPSEQLPVNDPATLDLVSQLQSVDVDNESATVIALDEDDGAPAPDVSRPTQRQMVVSPGVGEVPASQVSQEVLNAPTLKPDAVSFGGITGEQVLERAREDAAKASAAEPVQQQSPSDTLQGPHGGPGVFQPSHTMVDPDAIEDLIPVGGGAGGGTPPPESDTGLEPLSAVDLPDPSELMEPFDDGPTVVDPDGGAMMLQQLRAAQASQSEDEPQEPSSLLGKTQLEGDSRTKPMPEMVVPVQDADPLDSIPTNQKSVPAEEPELGPDPYAEEEDQAATALFHPSLPMAHLLDPANQAGQADPANQANQVAAPPEQVVQVPQQTAPAYEAQQEYEVHQDMTKPFPREGVAEVPGLAPPTSTNAPATGPMQPGPIAPTTPLPSPLPPPAKKKRSVMLPILVFLVVLGLAGGGATAYFFLVVKKRAAGDGTGTATTTKASPTAKPRRAKGKAADKKTPESKPAPKDDEAPTKPGVVIIQSSSPISGKLLLDGEDKGTLANTGKYSLEGISPGTHELEIRDGDRVFKKTITLKSGEAVSIKVAMPAAKAEPEPEPKAEPEPEPKAEPEPEPKAEPKPEPKAEPKPKPKAEPKPKPKAEPKPKPRPKPKAEPKPRPKPKPRPEAKPRPRPKKSRGKPGMLVVASRPWAKIYVDGKATGRNSPVPPSNPLSMPSGRHKITLEAKGQKFDFTVTIKAGKLSKLVKILPIK